MISDITRYLSGVLSSPQHCSLQRLIGQGLPDLAPEWICLPSQWMTLRRIPLAHLYSIRSSNELLWLIFRSLLLASLIAAFRRIAPLLRDFNLLPIAARLAQGLCMDVGGRSGVDIGYPVISASISTPRCRLQLLRPLATKTLLYLS